MDPKGDKVAVLWRYPEANNLGVRYRKAFLGIVDLTTRRIQPVPGASHAADPLVWALGKVVVPRHDTSTWFRGSCITQLGILGLQARV